MVCSLKKYGFHEHLSKSNFSFLKGSAAPKSLVHYINAFGYSSLALNDFDGLYGIARLFNDANSLLGKGQKKIKLLFGCELHLQKDHSLPVLSQSTLVLNVFNQEGYKNLCKIITYAHKDSKDEAFVSIDRLLQFDLSGLYGVIPMRGGLHFFNNNSHYLPLLKEKLSGDIYLAKTKTFHQYCDRNIIVVDQLSARFGLKKIISQDVFMAQREEKNFHDLLLCIGQNKTIPEGVEHFFPNGERSLHSLSEIHATYSQFSDFEECLKNSSDISARSQFCLSQLKYKYPQEMIPKGLSSMQFLEKVTWDGAKEKYGWPLSEKVTGVIINELKIIKDLGFSDYFLTVWDIVRWARSQDILCQGRGSAANSIVCFCLGITSCDPALFDLLFERFVSKERGDPPDIDVDFEHERREEVIQYIYRRYGRQRAAMVANVITFKSKGAARAVGKALGVSEQSLKSVSQLISTVLFRKNDIAHVLDEVKKNEKIEFPTQLPWGLWKVFARKLKGFPRHMGLHSGGFVISQNTMSELVPVEPATMEGRTIIQWAKDDIEELGFFKIDVLALGMLTALRKSFSYVNTHYDQNLNLENIPQEDAATYAMIQKAHTVGVFQIESRAQMSMLPRLKPKTFYDLVIEIAIIRPGPIQGKVIHPYLRRRDNLEKVSYPSEKIKPLLTKTLGIVLFQEQLMRIAIALGDFTAGEANELRKQIGTWNSKIFTRNLHPYINKLIAGLKKNGINNEFMKQMVEQMKGFAHYGFPESHAISFAYIAYASCYLKCHYPTAFFTSILNSQPMGFYSPHDLLRTAMSEGVKVLPLSVNTSGWDHTIEVLSEASGGRPKLLALRLGFRIVNGLSKSSVLHLEQVRKVRGAWKDFDDFISTTKISRDNYSAMAAANAFHCLGLSRSEAVWRAEAVPFKPMIETEDSELDLPARTEAEEVQMDFKSFGTSLGVHPAQLIKEKSWDYKIDKSKITTYKDISQLASVSRYKKPSMNYQSGKLVFVFGLVRVKQAPLTAKGMVFITLQDETGFVNLVFTPQVYKNFFNEIEGSGFLCVEGVLQNVSDSHSVLVKKVLSTSNKTRFKKKNPTKSSYDKDRIVDISPRGYF